MFYADSGKDKEVAFYLSLFMSTSGYNVRRGETDVMCYRLLTALLRPKRSGTQSYIR